MSRTLLVADDSVTIQKVVELTFSDSGHRVVGVGDGKTALETARELKPDLVLCDVIMPEINGYEVCRRLKADPLTADTPVLLLTGAFEPFDEERARDCGAEGHLTKPFESRVLLSRVEELLVAPGSGAEPPPLPEASASEEAGPREEAAEPPETLAETLPGPPVEPDPTRFEPIAWDEEAEPEAVAFEPAPPALEPDAGPAFTPEPEPTAPPAMSFAESEDWLEPELPEPPPAAGARAVLSPEPGVEAPLGEVDRHSPALDENPIVLDEEPDGELSTPVFPAAEAPAPDSPAPFDLAHALSDPSLRRLVEEAVERVVRDVVREVAWEIVPDLTETLLRQAARDQD